VVSSAGGRCTGGGVGICVVRAGGRRVVGLGCVIGWDRRESVMEVWRRRLRSYIVGGFGRVS